MTDSPTDPAELGRQQMPPEALRDDGDDDDTADDVEQDDAADGAATTATVREAIAGELDHSAMHGMLVTRRSGETIYLVVSRTTTMGSLDTAPDMDIPVIDIRTVAVDLETEAVSETENGLWVPADSEVAESLTKLSARTVSDVAAGEPIDEPAESSAADDVDPELFFERQITLEERSQNISRMRREPGIDPAREWGYGGGPPPELETVVDRLEEAGLEPTDHIIRLNWGKKTPHDSPREPVDDLDALAGNYGIEPQVGESGLVAIDIDYPDHFPDDNELPETFAVTSPHGTDDRKHLIYRCETKDVISEALGGVWSTQSPDWGDLWLGSRYTVGPGSQLSAFGCDSGDHSAGDPGGCERCSDPERGYYRIADDAPIAEVDAESIIELLPDDPREDIEEADDDAVDSIIDGHCKCDRCGDIIAEEDAQTVSLGGREITKCAGGCDGR